MDGDILVTLIPINYAVTEFLKSPAFPIQYFSTNKRLASFTSALAASVYVVFVDQGMPFTKASVALLLQYIFYVMVGSGAGYKVFKKSNKTTPAV